MAKRRRSRKRQKPNRPVLSAQPDSAQKALREGHYKSAINAYKALLKNEQRAEWITALAEAYEGRSWELAGKGMFKEAVAIWRNRAQICNLSLLDTHYLLWLLHAGSLEEALQLYRQHQQTLRPQVQNLRAHLAALALAGKEQILSMLPADDPVVRDHPAALQALQAYCDGDETDLVTALRQIAFRSPYRDLRIVLNALIEKHAQPGKIQDILNRIDGHSPFAPLAETVAASILDGVQKIETLAPMDPPQIQFVLALKHWPASHLGFLQELISLHQSPDDKPLLRFLIRHKNILGSDYSRKAAMRYVSHHPESTRAYDRGFGRPGAFDQARLIALMEDSHAQSPYDDYEYWDDALYQFQNTFDLAQEQNRIRAALLMRRIADVLERGKIEHQALTEMLEQSLEFDPDDPPTYLRLIRLYREERLFKDARRIQDRALQRYPRDTEVLLAIVETSIASNAFKKAAGFARRILEIDPINPKVRAILFDAHLAHARKQATQAKLVAALKELEQAAQWDNTQPAKAQIARIQGIMELRHDRPAGIKKLQDIMARQGYSLNVRFLMLMEADRLQRNPREVLKLLKLPSPQADPEQVLELVHTLQGLPEAEEERVSAVLHHLHQPLKKAARGVYRRTDMELLCEVFKRYEQPQLRQQYAKAALKRWPDTPLFVYHRIDAQMYVRDIDLQYLETALEEAHEAGDMRTVHRIDELLRSQYGLGEAPFDLAGSDDEVEEFLVMELIKKLGPEGFLEALESLNLPDFKQAREAYGDEQILEVLERVAQGESPLEDFRSPLPNPFKRRRKSPFRKPRKISHGTDSGDESDVDARADDIKQFDLF